MAQAENPLTTNSSRRQLPSSGIDTRWRDEVTMLLVKLSAHYWRPDFSEAMARELIKDFLDDLSGYTADRIREVCVEYRQNGDNHHFPTPGQLLSLLRASAPRRRHDTFTGYPEPETRATKTAAEILAEHGLK